MSSFSVDVRLFWILICNHLTIQKEFDHKDHACNKLKEEKNPDSERAKLNKYSPTLIRPTHTYVHSPTYTLSCVLAYSIGLFTSTHDIKHTNNPLTLKISSWLSRSSKWETYPRKYTILYSRYSVPHSQGTKLDWCTIHQRINTNSHRV